MSLKGEKNVIFIYIFFITNRVEEQNVNFFSRTLEDADRAKREYLNLKQKAEMLILQIQVVCTRNSMGTPHTKKFIFS